MSSRKSNYPERPIGGRRPSKPGENTKRSASVHIHGKRKTWMSLCNLFVGGKDVSPRLGFAWWKSPMMKNARLKKAASLRS